MSSSLFHMFLVELGSLHRTSNNVFYLLHRVTCFDSVSHNRVQVLSIPVLLLARSQDWTITLQMSITKKLSKPTPITVTLCVLLKKAGEHIGRNVVEITI